VIPGRVFFLWCQFFLFNSFSISVAILRASHLPFIKCALIEKPRQSCRPPFLPHSSRFHTFDAMMSVPPWSPFPPRFFPSPTFPLRCRRKASTPPDRESWSQGLGSFGAFFLQVPPCRSKPSLGFSSSLCFFSLFFSSSFSSFSLSPSPSPKKSTILSRSFVFFSSFSCRHRSRELTVPGFFRPPFLVFFFVGFVRDGTHRDQLFCDPFTVSMDYRPPRLVPFFLFPSFPFCLCGHLYEVTVCSRKD